MSPNCQNCTHHTSVVLEVEEDTVCSPPWLALADNDGGHDLLPQLRLSLLDGGHDHVSRTTSRQTVKTRTNTLDGDDVQVAGAGVVAAIHDGSAVLPLANIPRRVCDSMRERRFGEAVAFGENVHRQTESHLELVTGGRTSTAHMLVNIPDVIASSTSVSARKWGRTYPRLEDIVTDYWGGNLRRWFRGRRREIVGVVKFALSVEIGV
jgi:hypothetical protein